MSTKISGSKYAAMYGPTTGDKVRLADTSLVIEVEKDYTTYQEWIDNLQKNCYDFLEYK